MLSRFVFITLFVMGFSGFDVAKSKSLSKNLIWFPKDDGTGFLPAFLNSDGIRDTTISLPADPKFIQFFLYTQGNKDAPDEIFNSTESIDLSHWDRNAPVKIIVHGFGSTYNKGSSAELKKGYLENGYPTNANVVLVQWKRLAESPWYDYAAKNTKLVGEKIAYLITFLIDNHFTTLPQIHIGGHSLGTHAAAVGCFLFQKMNPGKIIPRLTGLDPALPLFGKAKDADRIDPSDAEIVDVIHTASGSIFEGELAFIEPRGTVDFYPNKGRDQPGCDAWADLVGACSHSRAYQYFAESIQSDNFFAYRCNDNAWDPKGDDKFQSCDEQKGIGNMGEWVKGHHRGIYYLLTNSKPPFAMKYE